MKIVFMGTPEFSVPILKMLNENANVILVVTQPDKPVGRKKELLPSPVKKFALEHNINVFQPDKLSKNYQEILSLNPDYIVTAAFGQMLPKGLIDVIPAINVHGSLLPKYRGGAPIQYALFNGDKKTGITIMHMAYKMDSGDMIKQQAINIAEDDNYTTLSNKLSILGADLLFSLLKEMKDKKLLSMPQDENEVTFAYTLKRDDEKINFNQYAQNVINRIRGLTLEPGGYFYHKDTLVKIYQVKKSDIISNNEFIAGTILQAKKKLIVMTNDQPVEIVELQVQGKKKMSAKDFLNGQSLFIEGEIIKDGENHE